MNIISNPIKQIKVPKFYPRDWDEFQETFTEYYGDIKEMLPEENRNLDGTIKIPYSAHIYVDKWHDTEAVYNFVKRLQDRGAATIASNTEMFWDVIPLNIPNNEIRGDFPSPQVDLNITNAVAKDTQKDQLAFPEMISIEEHKRLIMELQKDKCDLYNDCIQYERLLCAAKERIIELEKKLL
jgi:hypothetical protein